MDTQDYKDRIENASKELVDAMLDEDITELIEEGRQLDQKVSKLLRKVGLEMMSRLYSTAGAVVVEQQAKQKGMTVQRRPTVTFHVEFGALEVESPYLYDRQTGQSSRPMKDKFGVRGDSYSDAVDRALTEFGKETSFERAARRFKEHYGWEIGRTTVLRRTEEVAKAAETYVNERFSQARSLYDLPPAERTNLADEMLVESDGCHIRTGRLMDVEQARRKAKSPEEKQRLEQIEDDTVVRLQEWKEVRTGLARRPGQVDPTYVCRRGSWSEVIGDVFAAAREHGLSFETKVVAVADGAHGLKEAFELWFARLQFILDKPHLRDHFIETAEQLESLEDTLFERLEKWVAEQIEQISAGQVTEVVGNLTTLANRLDKSNAHDEAYERLDRLISHLTRFSRCVDYDDYKKQDWPIGSGEVESAHKSVPQARLKQPGACWREQNLNPMCALRVVSENEWWGDFWDWENERRSAA